MTDSLYLGLADLQRYTPKLFEDTRGHFFETYAAQNWPVTFVQENQSFSHAGVLRGLHMQAAPHAQGKLVRVALGAVYDVAVDARPESPDFGKWAGFHLTAENRQQLWIPAGFLHGFYALSDAVLIYKMTAPYAPQSETPVRWNDPTLNIDWPLSGTPLLSPKDAAAPLWRAVFGASTS